MKVFLTGLNGYVGSHLAQELTARGHDILAMIRSDSDKAEVNKRGFDSLKAELTDLDALKEAVAHVDAIAHTAASENPSFAPVNEAAIKTLINTMTPQHSFVMQSGSVVFGDTGPKARTGPQAFNPPPPLIPRAELEQWILDAGSVGRRTFIVYGSLVYGGKGAMIPNLLMSTAKKAGSGQYVGSGDNRWSTIHVIDWVKAMALALECGPKGGQAYFATGKDFSLKQIAEFIAEAIGTKGALTSLTFEQSLKEWNFFGPALAMNQVYSPDKAKKELGWQPQVDSFAEEIHHLGQSML